MSKRKLWVERRLSNELHKELLTEGYKGKFDLAGLIEGCQGFAYRFKQEDLPDNTKQWVVGVRVQISDLSGKAISENPHKWVDITGIDAVLDNAVARFWLKMNAMGRIKK